MVGPIKGGAVARAKPPHAPTALGVVVVLAVLYAIGSSSSAPPSPSRLGQGSLTSPIGLGSTTPASSASPPSGGPTAAPATPRPRASATAAAPRCTPTDQDRYVYHPARLQVVRACVRVSGTVQAVRREADGDLHILLALDSPYRSLLRPSNQGEELGDLVVEPVCVGQVTQADAVDVCASDPDPLPNRFPSVGEHVWMEGRYVFDLDHGSWAELHPLFRWGR
jgi:hypothetical protein